MGRPSLNLTPEEKKQRKAEYNLKYRSTNKGKTTTEECSKKYRETDGYRKLQREKMKKIYDERKMINAI